MKTLKTALVSACLIAGTFSSAIAFGQIAYPHDTVTLVTHSSPGGGTDVYLREMVKHLASIMGVNLVVENVRGGSGAKAMAKLAASPPDGSILYGTTPTYINTSLLSRPDNTYQDLEPLVNIFNDPQVVFVRADSPFATLRAALDDAKANPGKQKWGSGTPGSLERQALEKLKAITGVDAIIVTHDGGGDMMINVLNGTLDLGVGEIQEFRGQLDAGKLRIIGTFTEAPLDTHPDVPTAKAQGIDMVVTKFRGLAGPKGLGADVIGAWEAIIPKVLAEPGFKQWYEAAALQPMFLGHDDYAKFIADFAIEQGDFFKQYNITKD